MGALVTQKNLIHRRHRPLLKVWMIRMDDDASRGSGERTCYWCLVHRCLKLMRATRRCLESDPSVLTPFQPVVRRRLVIAPSPPRRRASTLDTYDQRGVSDGISRGICN